MKAFYCILSVVLGVFFISGCAQINRDNLRYSSVKRGNEVYKIADKDSLMSAKEHNEEAIKLYKEHWETYREQFTRKKDVAENQRQPKNPTQEKTSQDVGNKMIPPLIPNFEHSEKPSEKMQGQQVIPNGGSSMDLFWSKSVLEKLSNLDSNASQDLIRALSSTASIAQMRDLLTEPSFPALLPIERNVELGCLPPPDSAAFESVSKLSANLKQQGIDVGVSGEFASSVVKLFEESERTLFLQYALFRLCEMSVNAPSEFRNVYPVIIHDIVRRTAEMTQLANQEAEKRRLEEEKTKQMKLNLEMQKAKPDKESLYYSCIKSKLNAGLSDNEKIFAECKTLINSKPE